MTIKTLEYIHRILQKNMAIAEAEYKRARKAQYEMEEKVLLNEGDQSLKKKAEQLKAESDVKEAVYREAWEALQDFGDQDWR